MKNLLRNPVVSSLLGWVIWLYMAICNRTIRWRVEGDAEACDMWTKSGGVVIAAWHASILLLPSGWNRYIRRWPPKTRAAMLISMSRDGEAVAKAIKHLGLVAVRGSSNNKKKTHDKGGRRALAEALKLLKAGGTICITPDGPRGPAEVAQNGPIIMAKRTGSPILPYAITSAPAKRLGTWDGLRIPYPFSRGAVVFGAAIQPADKEREVLRAELETSLNAATRRAEAICAKKGPLQKERP